MANSTKAKTPARSAAKKGAKSAPARRPIRREVAAAVFFFVGLFSFIGYFSAEGLFISFFGNFIKGLIGYGYYIFPPAAFLCAYILATHRGRPVLARTICVLLLPVAVGALIHVLFCSLDLDFGKFGFLLSSLYKNGIAMHCGGVVSGLVGMGFKAMFSVYGAVPLLIFAIAALVFAAFRLNPAELVARAKEHQRLEYEPEPEPAGAPESSAAAQKRVKRAIDIPIDDEAQAAEYEEKKVGFFNAAPRVKTPDQVLAKHAAQETTTPEPLDAPEKPQPSKNPTEGVKPMSVQEAAKIAGVTPVEIKTAEVSSEEPAKTAKKSMDPNELKTETEAVAKSVEASSAVVLPQYRYPSVDLLTKPSGSAVDGREEIRINRERLQSTLDSFGVSATIAEITRGPTVTRYDLELDAGVKLNKLTNLAGDLALSLGVSGVRIAPIPDKISTVGVEVPNKIVSIVHLRSIIDSDAFRSASSKLTFAIGEDIGGSSVCGNIAKLPHMLIAGTTGSGKSVCMNCLILSLLYKAKPDEVKLIMIDPKMVELGIYNGIPHLYIPVVTDPKKAAGSLQWAVVEMLRRYRLFSEAGVRDINAYNAMQKNNGEPIMPQVVIVIDELADLMLAASKEVEESICRVAQMGRAAGMHLIIATQRPSADVITGLMKANIPSRIAFAVSSAMESRIILDTQGAEKLIGSGDMLYAPIGCGKPRRIQGAFVSDEEREKIVNFIKENSEADYSEDIMQQIEKAASEDKSGNAKAESVSDVDAEPQNDFDELLPQAVDVIFETKQASVSMLQRRLKLGYSRAARIVDQMEEIGVVGPFEGSKPRQILLTREQWQEMQLVNGTAPTETLPDQQSFADYKDENPENWDEET